MKCLGCHDKQGEAESFGPTRYASVQWAKFFEKEKHQKKRDIRGAVSREDLESIQGYLVSHAADSDRPEAAGMR